jgi:hypothetical protein
MRLLRRSSAVAWLTGPTAFGRAQKPADTIYQRGDIVTIDDKNPIAQVVAVKDDKIVAVGAKDDVFK